MIIRLLGAFLILVTKNSEAQTLYSGCDKSSYYDQLPGTGVQDWARADIHELIQSTHRNSLPYTNNDGEEDVWDALIDLDRNIGTDEEAQNPEETFVRLIYANVDIPAVPFGDPDNWNREHLWPKSRGVEGGGIDFSDVHHLRPSDWNG